MKPFEYFIETGEVKLSSKDFALAKSLINDMFERIKEISELEITKFAKLVFENAYDALRDFADAILAINGFKSYSHQASFSYLKRYDFEIPSLESLERYRYKRNGSKYYGYRISAEEAKEILEFYRKTEVKIKEIIKKEKLL